MSIETKTEIEPKPETKTETKTEEPKDLGAAIERVKAQIRDREPLVHNMYRLRVEESDILGKKETVETVVEDTRSWDADWGIVTRAMLAKKGNAQWKDKTIAEILCAIMYADSLRLNFEQGDVFPADGGRLSVTAHAKIKYAMNSGRVLTYTVKVEEVPEKTLKIPWATWNAKGVYEGPELKATGQVVLTNKSTFEAPPAFLSEWFIGRNPNWKERPRYMLSLNYASKILTLVAPLGGAESDEAPPIAGR